MKLKAKFGKSDFIGYWKTELKWLKEDYEYRKNFIEQLEKQLYKYKVPPTAPQQEVMKLLKEERINRKNYYKRKKKK